MVSPPTATIYTAREIVTLDPARSSATAVAVVNGRILWAGSLEEVKAILGEQPFTIDTTFADHVIVPGFVAQHDHPVLAALTMSSEILSIEDWVLPTGTVPAVKDKQDFMDRLAQGGRSRRRTTDERCSPGAITPPSTARSPGRNSTPSAPRARSSSGAAPATRCSSTPPPWSAPASRDAVYRRLLRLGEGAEQLGRRAFLGTGHVRRAAAHRELRRLARSGCSAGLELIARLHACQGHHHRQRAGRHSLEARAGRRQRRVLEPRHALPLVLHGRRQEHGRRPMPTMRR